MDSRGDWLIRKFQRFACIDELAVERVKFDIQLMQNHEISGVEYQRAALIVFTVKEYVLEKLHRQCAYCDEQNVPFEIEHIRPKSRGGSDRVSNLALSCVPCNQRKARCLLKRSLKTQLG